MKILLLAAVAVGLGAAIMAGLVVPDVPGYLRISRMLGMPTAITNSGSLRRGRPPHSERRRWAPLAAARFAAATAAGPSSQVATTA